MTRAKKVKARAARRERVVEKFRRQAAARARRRDERAYRADYPAFVFADGEAPTEFAALVRAAAGSVRLDDPDVFPDFERAAYRAVRRYGAAVAAQLLGVVPGEGRLAALDVVLLRLGQLMLDRIPQADLLRYVPFHDAQFVAAGRDILVRFRSLRGHRGPRGTAYHSRHRPTLDVDGAPRVVAFSEHAVRRACERVVPNWSRYGGLGDAFALFDQCLEFERCDLRGGRLGFTLYENCAPGFWSHSVARRVLGPAFDPAADYAYRIGYCPAVIEGEFVKAVTLLFPGQRATPERAAILDADLDREDRERLIAEAEVLDTRRLWETEDVSLLRWFHERGVPQVVPRRVRYAPPA